MILPIWPWRSRTIMYRSHFPENLLFILGEFRVRIWLFDVMFFVKLVVLIRYLAQDLYFQQKIWTPRTERVLRAGKVNIVRISLSIITTGVRRRMLHVCGSPMGLA